MNKRTLLPLIAAMLLSIPYSTTTAQELDTLKANTERWIHVRNRLSTEKADWQSEKRILADIVATLESSKEAVEQNVAYHSDESAKLSKQVAESEARLKRFEETNQYILAQIVEYERRILALSKRLPSPLLDELQSSLVKIPKTGDDKNAPLPNRLQNVVAIMTLIDEFNSDLTLSHTIKELDSGEVIDVRVLYWGLASGYASNADGANAWILKPGEDGWRWEAAGEHATAIKQLFDVYDKIVDPALVPAPFQISRTEAN